VLSVPVSLFGNHWKIACINAPSAAAKSLATVRRVNTDTVGQRRRQKESARLKPFDPAAPKTMPTDNVDYQATSHKPTSVPRAVDLSRIKKSGFLSFGQWKRAGTFSPS
jgi:hypothetical protein